MAETVSDAYAITGDPKYLTLARRFTHHAVFDPLAARQDKLDGLHSNTNIPKLIGYERIYELTGDAPYHVAPQFFWQTVAENRSYANGGNGDYEHFFPPTEFGNHVHSDFATETCCTYNMLKLSLSQFIQDPSAGLRRILRARRPQPHPGLAGADPGPDALPHAHEARPLQGLRGPRQRLLVLHRHRHREPRPLRRGYLLPKRRRPRAVCQPVHSLDAPLARQGADAALRTRASPSRRRLAWRSPAPSRPRWR